MQILSTHPSDHRGTNALKRALADIDAPNWCVAYGDRIEMLEAANRERYKGKKIIHVGGGETSHWDARLTHPDHWTRDALTMISSLHFVANDWARVRLALLGVTGVHVTGCPSLDEIVAYAKTLDPNRKREGVFEWFPEIEPRWENHKEWHANLMTPRLTEQEFLHRIAHCTMFRTNSSAGLREAPILGTTVEMIGDRQKGRAPAGTYHDKDGLACYNIRKVILEHCNE